MVTNIIQGYKNGRYDEIKNIMIVNAIKQILKRINREESVSDNVEVPTVNNHVLKCE